MLSLSSAPGDLISQSELVMSLMLILENRLGFHDDYLH